MLAATVATPAQDTAPSAPRPPILYGITGRQWLELRDPFNPPWLGTRPPEGARILLANRESDRGQDGKHAHAFDAMRSYCELMGYVPVEREARRTGEGRASSEGLWHWHRQVAALAVHEACGYVLFTAPTRIVRHPDYLSSRRGLCRLRARKREWDKVRRIYQREGLTLLVLPRSLATPPDDPEDGPGTDPDLAALQKIGHRAKTPRPPKRARFMGRPRGRPKGTADGPLFAPADQVVLLRLKGLSLRSIAAELGVSEALVRQRLKEEKG